MAQVDSAQLGVRPLLPLVEPVAPVVQHQQILQAALLKVASVVTVVLCPAAMVESQVPVVLRRLPLRAQECQQPSAAPAETVVRPLPEQRLGVVPADLPRQRRAQDRPQPVVVVETAAMVQQARVETAALEAQLFSIAAEIALLQAVRAAHAEPMDQTTVLVVLQWGSVLQRTKLCKA